MMHSRTVSGEAVQRIAVGPEVETAATYRKVTRRLIPFLFLCYILNYLDRLNIGFAKLGFSRDLGFDDRIFGVGVAMFFVGYLLFEFPSTLALARWGAKKTVSRIMVLWGACTIATMFIANPMQFYLVRALLGMAEAGFLPGIVLYLTFWYPARMRARITALFMSSLPIAGILSGPIAGAVMKVGGQVGGLRDWQWLFLIEGVPAVVMGLVALFYLCDSPRQAKWLTPSERAIVIADLSSTTDPTPSHGSKVVLELLRDPRIYVLAFLGFAGYCTANTIAFWAPTIINGSGVTDKLVIGLLSALPSVAGLAGMIWNGRHSDRTLERRWHAAGAALVAVVGLGLIPVFHQDTVMAVALLTLAGLGHFAFTPMTWAIPSLYLGKSRAAAGIGIFASFSSLGGVVAPMILGWAKTSLGSFSAGLYMIDAMVVLAVVLMLVFIPKDMLREKTL